MFKRVFTYGGKRICFICRTSNCHQLNHETVYVGAKCRTPKRHDRKGWQKLQYICHQKNLAFTTECPEYFALKEIYADEKRRADKPRKAIYRWNMLKKSIRTNEKLNANGWVMYDKENSNI